MALRSPDRAVTDQEGNVSSWLRRSSPTRSAASIARSAIIAVAGIALLVPTGWLFRIQPFMSIVPQWPPMSIIAACCFLLLAVEMAWLQRDPAAVREGLLLQAPAFLVGLVGVVTIVLYAISLITGQAPPVGQIPLLNLFWQSTTRLALLTAILFFCTGCALALLAGGGRRAVDCAHLIMVAVGLAGYMVILGYLLKAEPLHRLLNVSVAMNTALAFCILSVAMLHMRPDSRLMGAFTSDRVGGIMARRLLPAILLIPLVIGWIRLHGERSGLFSSEVGVVLVALIYATLLLGLLWLTARSVNRSDEQRHLAEQQFSTFFSLTPDLVAIAGFDGRFRELSPSWEETLGWPRAKLLAGPYLDFVHPDDRAATEEVAARLASGDPVRQFVNRYRHRDGSYRWIEWYAVPVAELGVTYNAARDITEHVLIEKELADSRQELSAMLENAPLVILLVDRERRVRKANATAAEFANRSEAEMMGLRGGEALRCLHALDAAEGCGFGPACENCAVRRTVLETFATGSNQHGVEAAISFGHHGRLEELTFLISTSLLTLSDEQLCLVCIDNITERKLAEKVLQTAHKGLEQRVAERTTELLRLNKTLEAEIIERQRVEEKIRTLNEQLEQRVIERTAELENKNLELEKMNRIFIGRELRMIELKQQIKELQGNADTEHQD